MEAFGCEISDKSIALSGKQRIKTRDVMPLSITNGLPHMPMRPYTDKEWEELPHVFLSGANPSDPEQFDSDYGNDEDWYDAMIGMDDR